MDAIFNELFRLPRTTYSQQYCASILCDLCRVKEAQCNKHVIEAVVTIMSKLDKYGDDDDDDNHTM